MKIRLVNHQFQDLVGNLEISVLTVFFSLWIMVKITFVQSNPLYLFQSECSSTSSRCFAVTTSAKSSDFFSPFLTHTRVLFLMIEFRKYSANTHLIRLKLGS